MTVRIIVRVADYANTSYQGSDHFSFKTVDVECAELERLLRLDYGNRKHAEVIGGEVLVPSANKEKP